MKADALKKEITRARNSKWEDEFFWQLQADSLPEPVRQFAFHPTRNFRFDFAWPLHKLAVEVDGGSWINGAHSRGLGYEKDCFKLDEAAILGWTVLRFVPAQVKSGYAVDAVKRWFAK